MADLKKMVKAEPADASVDFDALPASADDATRQRVAETLAPQIAQNLSDYPWLSDPTAHQSKSPKVTQETFVETVRELFNPAQMDVLARASVIATQQVSEASAATSGATQEARPDD